MGLLPSLALLPAGVCLVSALCAEKPYVSARACAEGPAGDPPPARAGGSTTKEEELQKRRSPQQPPKPQSYRKRVSSSSSLPSLSRDALVDARIMVVVGDLDMQGALSALVVTLIPFPPKREDFFSPTNLFSPLCPGPLHPC